MASADSLVLPLILPKAHHEYPDECSSCDTTPRIIRMDSQAGTSTVLASVVNLFKAIAGIGVVALPAGVAAFTDTTSGLLPGLLVAGALATISAYTFWLVGRLCLSTSSRSYVELLVFVYGAKARWPVQCLIVAKTTTSCLMYQIIIGDLAWDLGKMIPLQGLISQRNMLLGLLSLLVLLPLSLRKTLASLAPFAALGSLGTLYTVLFMGLRLTQGAYAYGGALWPEAPYKPCFDQRGTRFLSIFKLISMLAVAYIAHFNAPRFVNQLKFPTSQRFAVVTWSAFGMGYAVMALIMVFGFLTFGGASQGMILNNYAVTDWYASAADVATLLSVVSAYPFTMVACRDGWVELLLSLKGQTNASAQMRMLVTSVLVLVLANVAMVIQDLGLVVQIAGAILATSIVYVLPALALLGILGPQVREGTASRVQRFEHAANVCLLGLGVVLAVIGVLVVMLE